MTIGHASETTIVMTIAELQMHYVAGSLSLGPASTYCWHHESVCLVSICLMCVCLGHVDLMSTKAIIDPCIGAESITSRCCTDDRQMLTGESLMKVRSSIVCSKAAPLIAYHFLRRLDSIGGIRLRLFYAKTETTDDLCGDPYSTVFSTTTSLASYDPRHCFCDDGLSLICCDFGCSDGDCCSRDTASSDAGHGGSGGSDGGNENENASEKISGGDHFCKASDGSHLTDFLLGKCSITGHDDGAKRIDDAVSQRGDHLHKIRDLCDS